ncbi:MAG: D-3-phosphoglycerate dehydrogenase / 2-oxoglutarate reductase [Thermomicrobiales bacterium]|nr:D-3-phosphoglycerate dehydrogenase / 2-oxoglutarate reductase [Thermomicrobiales bacterium]
MRPRVVIAYAKPGEAPVEEEILRAAGIEVVLTGELESESARTAAREAEALMVGLNRISADLMDELTRLKIVTRVGTGVDAIDIAAATTRGIWVTNVPDYSIDEVSTHAISLVLAQARMLFPHRVAGRDGRWRYRAETPIRRFAGQTIGVLGMGRIGSASARKGRGLGLEVIAHDPYLPDERFEELGVRRVDFDTLMRESDFLTLHVPLTDETRRIVDARALSLMKPTAYLVNTARGEVIDVDALVEAVRAGTIAGAGIDVLPEEPPAADHPILHDDRIIVTPHIGWASVEAGHDSKVRGSEDVVRVLRGERPKYPINEIDRVPARAAG